MPTIDLPPSERSKWIIVVLFIAFGLGFVSKTSHSFGIAIPCLIVFILAAWLKIILEFVWKLPIRFLHLARLEPHQRAARERALIFTSIGAIVLSSILAGGFFGQPLTSTIRVIVAGISMVTVGFLLRVRPMGLSLSNPAAIPKSDPHAGLLIAQSLPSTIGPIIGLCLILSGAVSLLIYWLMSRTPPDA